MMCILRQLISLNYNGRFNIWSVYDIVFYWILFFLALVVLLSV